MSFISNKCRDQLSTAQRDKMEFAMGWAAVREYKRVHGEDMAAWDQAAKAAFDAAQAGDKGAKNNLADSLDPGSKAFMKDVFLGTAMMKAPLPGWNDATCTMDWKEWACFCNNAAKLNWNADALTGFTKLSYDCDPSVKADPAYACADAPCAGSAEKQGLFSGWLPWAIGGAFVVTVTGAVLMATGKIGNKNPDYDDNPSNKKYNVVFWDSDQKPVHELEIQAPNYSMVVSYVSFHLGRMRDKLKDDRYTVAIYDPKTNKHLADFPIRKTGPSSYEVGDVHKRSGQIIGKPRSTERM